jgi:hypothetical protein
MIEMFAALIVAHAVCDYPLQGDFLSKAKNRFDPIPGVPWYQAMGAHAFMHGGAVWMITGSLWLGLAEAVAHFAIDDWKCGKSIGFNADQALHVVCKLAWVGIAAVIA